MMVVHDKQLDRDTVNARLSRGAAFSIVVAKDQASRRGVYPVIGMALDPYMISMIDMSDVAFENDGNIKAELYCHFFDGWDVSETIFTERASIHNILGQIRYTATTKITFYYWDRGIGNPSGNGWDAFRECLISPVITQEADIPNQSVRLYRNNSIFPVFKNGEGTILNITDMDLIRLNHTHNGNNRYNFDALLHRSYSPELFGRVKLNPTTERLTQGHFLAELVTRMSFNHAGIFAPRLTGDLGYRMCGNTSSMFDFEKVTMPDSNTGVRSRALRRAAAQVAQSFEALNNTASAAAQGVVITARQMTAIGNRRAAIAKHTPPPIENNPPAYDQFNRERDL